MILVTPQVFSYQATEIVVPRRGTTAHPVVFNYRPIADI
jgi:hypothetical protein